METLTFTAPPRYQGQIVEISFASNEDGIYRRTFDRSTGTATMEFAPWRKSDKPDACEPWNDAPDERRRWRKVGA